MKSLLILSFLVLGGMGSCHSTKESVKLEDVKWVLETLNGEAVKLSEEGSAMFVKFNAAEGRVNGCAVCNRFFGDFELDGAGLKFSHMGATRMACRDMEKEDEFFRMMDKVDGYAIKDNILSFLSKDKVVATFRKSAD